MYAPSVGHAGRRAGRRTIPRLRAALAGLLLLLALPGGALADAALVASTPAADEALTAVPPEATLEFDHALTGASSFVILDSAGATVATGAPDRADTKVMRAPLPTLAPGPYVVRWTAGSDDGHIVRGAFEFSVAAPTAPTPSPTAAPTDAPAATSTAAPTDAPATTAPTVVPTASPGDEDDGADSGGDVLLPILAVAVLVGGGLLVMLRRRGPA